MQSEPQKEHRLLEKLLGEWSGEFECDMGPDQPAARSKGTEVVRSIGGLFTVAEGQGDCPMTGKTVQSIMTLGYDPQRNRYVGAFICSMMTHLWRYEGTVDSTGRKLVLDTEGPDFTPGKEGSLAKYTDTLEFVDDDHRVLTSHILGDDGEWRQVMTGRYRRTKQGRTAAEADRPAAHQGVENEVYAADLQ
jgi:hypothetical protein